MFRIHEAFAKIHPHGAMKATAETIKWSPLRAFTSRPEAAFLVAVRLIRHQDLAE
jgi:hypothetical protein